MLHSPHYVVVVHYASVFSIVMDEIPYKALKDQCSQGLHLVQPGALLKASVSCLKIKLASPGTHRIAEIGNPTHNNTYTRC